MPHPAQTNAKDSGTKVGRNDPPTHMGYLSSPFAVIDTKDTHYKNRNIEKAASAHNGL